MNKEEAREAIKEAYGNSEYTDEIIKALEQEPCDTCGYEEGSIYCKEHCPHEAKIEQELTEFEEIDFMQEHKKIPVTLDLTSCEDAISRKIISAFLSGLISDDVERKKALEYINELPPVNPTKTGHWVGVDGDPSHLKDGLTTESVWCSLCGEWLTASDEYSCFGNFCPNCGAKMVEPQERSDK